MIIKKKTLKLKTIITIAIIGVFGSIYFVQNLLNSGSKLTTYADEAKKVDVKATGSITVGNVTGWTWNQSLSLNIELLNPSIVKSGDYFDVKFKNFYDAPNAAFNNIDVRDSSGRVIGRSTKIYDTYPELAKKRAYMNVGSRDISDDWGVDDFSFEVVYRIVFNENIGDNSYISMNFTAGNINGSNLGINNNEYEYQVAMLVNDAVISAETVRARAVGRSTKLDSLYLPVFETLYYEKDGEKYIQDAYAYGGNHLTNIDAGEYTLRVGDIFTFEFTNKNPIWKVALSSNALLLSNGSCDGKTVYAGGYNIGNNYNLHGFILYPKMACLKWEILENTDKKVSVRFTEVGDGDVIYWPGPISFSPVDKSHTVEKLEDGTLKALNDSYRWSIVKADGSIRKESSGKTIARTMKSEVSSSSIVEVAQRGSVSLDVVDEFGNKLRDIEILKENALLGEKYNVENPVVAGYTFEKLTSDSAPREGVVKKGEQIVKLQYKIIQNPQTVKTGENPDPKAHILDFEKNFPGCMVKYKTAPDTSKAGEFDVVLVISCQDKNDREISTKLIVEEEESAQETVDESIRRDVAAPNTGFKAVKSAILPLAVFAGIVIAGTIAVIAFRKK